MAIHFPQIYLLKRLSFHSEYFWHLCQKSGGYICVGLDSDQLLCSTDLSIWLCASTVLFLLSWLWNTTWNQISGELASLISWFFVLFSQNCLHYSVFFCISKWILRPFFCLCEEWCWNFDGDCIENVNSLWYYRHFNSIDSFKRYAWEPLLSASIFFSFSLSVLNFPF